MLNALCGRAYYGKTTGKVWLNGEEDSVANYPRLMSFVPQKDIVHETLTCRENLYYAGELRLPSGTPKATISALVRKTLRDLEIAHVADSIVGGVSRKGISGGQLKRVNIGIGVMAMPSVLFLDEPTSGLDSASVTVVCGSLAKLTDSGMTVVSVIHQPRYSVYETFDQVFLLGKGGFSVYQGAPPGAVTYLESLGYKLPENDNPADFLLDVTSGSIQSSNNPEKSSPKETLALLEAAMGKSGG